MSVGEFDRLDLKDAQRQELKVDRRLYLLHLDGHTARAIAFREGLDVARVKAGLRREKARLSRGHSGRNLREKSIIRLERIIEHAIRVSSDRSAEAADVAKVQMAAVNAQKQLSAIAGLNAPVRSQVETMSLTLVRREDQVRLLADPAYRELQSRMDQHVINIGQAHADPVHPGGVRPRDLGREVDLPAAPRDAQPPDDGPRRP